MRTLLLGLLLLVAACADDPTPPQTGIGGYPARVCHPEGASAEGFCQDLEPTSHAYSCDPGAPDPAEYHCFQDPAVTFRCCCAVNPADPGSGC